MMEATLLEDVPAQSKVCSLEVFGPLAVLSSFRDFDDALEMVNDSVYGLQAGIFTRDIYKVQKAWDTTCPTAGSRTAASAGKGSTGPWRI
jgi:acyl-CoA reductase-like NAD-dependent aldehyde dehydrogenase